MDRYSRHVLFSGIGKAGQERLLASRVAVLGCGALGCMQAEMLARAGIGYLRIIDRDFIEPSNLQRQILFDEADADRHLPKAVAAQNRIGRINSDIRVEAATTDARPSNIESLVAGVDLVLDGTDNFETRFLLNDACVKLGIPWVYGAAVGATGVTMTILPERTPCLRCILEACPAPGTSPTCDTAGIILPAIASVVSAQVTEALKILTGRFENLRGTLLQIDLWDNSQHSIKLKGVREAGNCPCCKLRRFEFLDAAETQATSTLCGRNAVQINPARRAEAEKLDLRALADRLRPLGEVTVNAFLLRFRLGEIEMTVFPDARAIVKGIDDVLTARGLYAKYVGS